MLYIFIFIKDNLESNNHRLLYQMSQHIQQMLLKNKSVLQKFNSIFQMQVQKISYEELVERVEEWHIPSRVDEKYHYWKLKYHCPRLSQHWLGLIHHSLLFYMLNYLPAFFQNHPPSEVIQFHTDKMQTHYSMILLQHQSKFDLKIVILVKIVTYFIGSHYPQTLANDALQNDIYQFIILILIGIPVEPKAYQALLKSLKNRKNRDRSSFQMETTFNNICIPTTKSIKRRNGKTRNNLTQKMTQIERQFTQFQNYKKCLKENLYVKPIPKPKPTQVSIQQLKNIKEQENPLELVKNKPKKIVLKQGNYRKRDVIGSNQISKALHINSSLRLTEIKNFSIHCSPKKQIQKCSLKPFKLNRPQASLKKTKRDIPSEKHAFQEQKSPKKWLDLLEEMREKTYKRKKLATDPNQITEMAIEERLSKLTEICESIQFPKHQSKSIPVIEKKFHKQMVSCVQQSEQRVILGQKHVRLLSQQRKDQSQSMLPLINHK